METDIRTPRPAKGWWLWWLLIVLAICGCTASPTALTQRVSPTSDVPPESVSTPVPTMEAPTATAPVSISAETPAASDNTSPTITPPQPTDTVAAVEYPICEEASNGIDASFVADLGLPDGAAIPPDTPFRKTWRVRNTGDCTWPEGTELIHISGDTIPGPDQASVSPTSPGSEVDIMVDLESPASPGKYASFWRLQMASGQLFGAVVYLEVIVSQDAAPPTTIVPPPPTATHTAEPAPTSTPVPTATPVPTPNASPTPSPTPTTAPPPTSSPTPDPNAPCESIDPRFGPVVYQANVLGIGIPCITAPVSTETGVLQLFWQDIDGTDPPVRLRGFVIVRSSTNTIYVLDGRDPVTYKAEARAYENKWTEGMPDKMDACAPIVPPPGYTVPVQSIGKIWCEQSLWNSLGWPDTAAQPVTLSLQGSRSKLLVEISTGTGQPYTVAIDLDARAATVYQAP